MQIYNIRERKREREREKKKRRLRDYIPAYGHIVLGSDRKQEEMKNSK